MINLGDEITVRIPNDLYQHKHAGKETLGIVVKMNKKSVIVECRIDDINYRILVRNDNHFYPVIRKYTK